MKKSFKLFCKGIAGVKIMLLAVAIVCSNGIYAQEKQSITGRLIEEKRNNASIGFSKPFILVFIK